MNRWRPTAALSRAVLVGGGGLGAGVLAGQPALLVLTAPLVACAALALVARPSRRPVVSARLDHVSLHEGQGTTSRLHLVGAEDAEQVTRVATRAAYLASHPADGRLSRLLSTGTPDIEISPRRWGRRVLGEEKVALTTRWAGFRWGPVSINGSEMRVLPATAAYDSRADTPRPLGLVGSHRSTRAGDGTEFSGIRAFEVGDRLRRINWRVSARTGRLHVTTARAEQDTGVLLVVDAIADHGRSDGIDGRASSLDVTLRAAAAIAEHAVREGDRVALRIVGGDCSQVGFGAGGLHLRRLLGTMAAVVPGDLHGHADRLRLRVTNGTTVIVLSPMLSELVGTAAATTVRRGLPTLVVDTLPAEVVPVTVPGADVHIAGLGWRMRKLEREQVLSGLAAIGCPIVPWRGPGTLDDVLRRLTRRAELPQIGTR
ncbi:MAG: DUF58 domain-containing protein [Nocardioides sp.]